MLVNIGRLKILVVDWCGRLSPYIVFSLGTLVLTSVLNLYLYPARKTEKTAQEDMNKVPSL